MSDKTDLVTVCIGEGIGIRMRRDEAERLGLLDHGMQEPENPEAKPPQRKRPAAIPTDQPAAETKRRRNTGDKSRKPEGDK